jgi:signal transduction histidine kinase
MSRRSSLVYGLLLAAWFAIAGWQAVEHRRVVERARAALENRGRDITQIVSLVVRSQRRFGVTFKDRLESAFKDLIRKDDVESIVLLNADGEEVASAGVVVDIHSQGGLRGGVHWEPSKVTLYNLVDLGTNSTRVISPSDFPQGDTNRPSAASSSGATNRVIPFAQGLTNVIVGEGPANEQPSSNRFRFSRNGSYFGRPSWLSEAEYKALLQRQGLHSFFIVLSTQNVHAISEHDLWLRTVVCIFALGAVVGAGVAWQNLVKSSELQIRLVRASEQNTHLKELNLAAAGLAHETRNPLNIIRGLAQMISKDAAVTGEIRQRSRDIAEEADRVTAQLSEFINYSRPREVRRAGVPVGSVVKDVARALVHDLEEKQIRLQGFDDPVVIEADEQLLRQALFNLLINAVQALPPGGEINVGVQRNNGSLALEVRDNGPGVPPNQRHEIFKPYFTTHQKGSGLGLAVVQQIVSAHDWDIECTGNEPKGAVFRISRMKVINKAG